MYETASNRERKIEMITSLLPIWCRRLANSPRKISDQPRKIRLSPLVGVARWCSTRPKKSASVIAQS
jgi:hypothetical protein